MTNPFHSAILASGYIVLVASIVYYGPRFVGNVDSIVAPVSFLSLFVLSAAVMGFLFFYRPAELYLDGFKKESVQHFLKTLFVFAVITSAFLLTLLFLFRVQ